MREARANPLSSFISIDSNENLITKGWLFKLRRVIFLAMEIKKVPADTKDAVVFSVNDRLFS